MAEQTYDKPLPNLEDPAYAAFWEAAKSHRLTMPKCGRCGHIRWPAGPACTECLATETEWVTLSGRGELFSWVNFHQGYHPAWAKETPYNVSMVKLAEGPVFLTNLVEYDAAELRVGLPVEVVFDEVTETVAIPKFRPAK